MIIAHKKRKENVAEYMLYMFQVEDLIRALNLSVPEIEKTIISQYNQPYNIKRDILEWYKSLIIMMKDNHLEQKGHVPMLTSLIEKLNGFHLSLLDKANETEYASAFNKAKPALEELKRKSGNKNISDIELSLNGLYGLLMLKIQKKTINPETETAFGFISDYLALLSREFQKLEIIN